MEVYIGLGCCWLYYCFSFLIRNIIISGYILYPYAQLDFFHVDWKMPKELVVFDHNEIIVWGRNLNDVRKYDWGIESWFPIWWETLTKAQMFLCYEYRLFYYSGSRVYHLLCET